MKRLLTILLALAIAPAAFGQFRVITAGGSGGAAACALCLESDGTGWPVTAPVVFSSGVTINSSLLLISGTASANLNGAAWAISNASISNGTSVAGVNAHVSNAAATSGRAIMGRANTGYGGFFQTTGASANPVVYIEGDTAHTGLLLDVRGEGDGSPLFGVELDGAASFADGTVSNPSMVFRSDDDGSGTGFYRGVNIVKTAINGVHQMSVGNDSIYLAAINGNVQFGYKNYTDRTGYDAIGITMGGALGAQTDFDMAFQAPSADYVPSSFTLTGQAAQTTAVTNLDGGNLTFTGGAGASGSAGDADGGNIVLVGGTGYGTGDNGYIDAQSRIIVEGGTVADPAISWDHVGGGGNSSGIYFTSDTVHFEDNGNTSMSVALGGIANIRDITGLTAPTSNLLNFSQSIIAEPSTRSLTNRQGGSQGYLITNEGATSLPVLTLLTAAAGLSYDFIGTDATDFAQFVPAAGDEIIWVDGTVVSAATGSITTTARYQSFSFRAVDATTWVADRVEDRGTAMTIVP